MTLISPKVIARPREVRSLIDHSVGFFLGDTKAFNNIFYAESSWSFYIQAYGVVIVTQQVICTFSNDNAGLLLGKLLDYLRLNIVKINVRNEALVRRLNDIVLIRRLHKPFDKVVAPQLFVHLKKTDPCLFRCSLKPC